MIAFLDGRKCSAGANFNFQMNAVLAQLRQEREERLKVQDVNGATIGASSVDCAEVSGARRRKQSAPRRIVRESIPSVVSDENDDDVVVEVPPQRKKRKEGNPAKLGSGPVKEDSASSKKESRPRGKIKNPPPVSSIEFEEENNDFDAQELAS
jgi:hypothetical protein